MYWPFFDSGFTISGVDKVDYQHNTSITFNCSYLPSVGSSRSVIWNFYKSSDYSLIKSTTGISSTTSFTYEDGKDGIDIEMILSFGIHMTKFRKRRRVVIVPDFSSPTRTLDISTIPMLSGGAAFSNSASATVTNGSANVTTSAAHGASVGDIIVFTQSGTQRTYKAITGTTGTTIVLDRNFEGTTGTVTNTNTRRGVDIQHRFDATSWNPGDIVKLTGTLYTARCRWINMNGNSTDQIWLTVGNGTNVVEFVRMGTAQDDVFQLNDLCSHIRIIGDRTSSDGNGYRLKFTNGGFSAQHFSIGNTHDDDDVRISTIRVHNADSTGIKPKLDSVSRDVGAFDDCWVYGCWITSSINEGIYMGYFNYNYDSTFIGGNYHHAMKRAKCFANYASSCGWDGMQMSSCDEGAEFGYNFMKNNAQANPVVSGQNFGAVMNGGFNGHFYNNIIIGNTVQCFPSYTTYIYNNVVYNTTYGNALFVRRADNPNLGSPVHNPYDPAAILYCWNNILVSLADSIYILDINDQGGTLSPLAEIWVVNNFLGYVGSVVEGYIRYNEPASGQTRTITPNITVNGLSTVPNSIRFNDLSNDDTRLLNTSSVFLAANDGLDITTKLVSTNLPIKMFTDITDQVIPDKGYWKQSPYHEYVGYETQLSNYMGRTQIQFYQTAQSSVFSDKVKIPRFFGGKIKGTNEIGSSSKPKYLSEVIAYPNSGTPSPETLDNESIA